MRKPSLEKPEVDKQWQRGCKLGAELGNRRVRAWCLWWAGGGRVSGRYPSVGRGRSSSSLQQ